MQIKTTMSYHLTHFRMTTIKKTRKNKCWFGHGGREALIHYWWNCKLVQPLRKTVRRLLKKKNTELPYDVTILLLGI